MEAHSLSTLTQAARRSRTSPSAIVRALARSATVVIITTTGSSMFQQCYRDGYAVYDKAAPLDFPASLIFSATALAMPSRVVGKRRRTFSSFRMRRLESRRDSRIKDSRFGGIATSASAREMRGGLGTPKLSATKSK